LYDSFPATFLVLAFSFFFYALIVEHNKGLWWGGGGMVSQAIVNYLVNNYSFIDKGSEGGNSGKKAGKKHILFRRDNVNVCKAFLLIF
jgi:hypothetical protein